MLSNFGHNVKNYLTKAMILGGLLKRVWKNRLLLMRWGDTRAERVYIGE